MRNCHSTTKGKMNLNIKKGDTNLLQQSILGDFLHFVDIVSDTYYKWSGLPYSIIDSMGPILV